MRLTIVYSSSSLAKTLDSRVFSLDFRFFNWRRWFAVEGALGKEGGVCFIEISAGPGKDWSLVKN